MMKIDKNYSYISVFSLCLSSFRSSSSFTESPSLFPDRYSVLRCEGFDLRAEARAAQPSSVTLHLLNL